MPRSRKPDLLDQLWNRFSLRGLLLHQATLFVGATILLIGGLVFLWENHQGTIVDPEAYQLTEDKIDVPPAPDWVDTDLRELIVAGEASSILDPDLVSKTAAKIRSVGFVERVNQIVKSKAGLRVDVQYRQPVAVVELSSQTIMGWQDDAVRIYLPVDRMGVLMPRDRVDIDGLPKLCMLYPAKILPDKVNSFSTWRDIDDVRVRDGAAIAQYFANDAQRIGINRIVTWLKPDEVNEQQAYELWPHAKNGSYIIWGQAPGKELSDEAPVEQKLVALESYIQQVGSLDAPKGATIDIRTGVPIVVPKNKVAQRKLDHPLDRDAIR